MPRDVWGKNEETRPLLPVGKTQAVALAGLLSAWSPKKVHVSPWTRCKATVEPYAKRRELELHLSDELTEAASQKHPDKTLKRVHRIIQNGDSAIICSHRPAIPVILQEIAKYQSPKQMAPISGDLVPGEFLVIHLTKSKPGVSRKIVAIEKYKPLAEEKK
jgi:8-oxo-dGTP diphosphatase